MQKNYIGIQQVEAFQKGDGSFLVIDEVNNYETELTADAFDIRYNNIFMNMNCGEALHFIKQGHFVRRKGRGVMRLVPRRADGLDMMGEYIAEKINGEWQPVSLASDDLLATDYVIITVEQYRKEL